MSLDYAIHEVADGLASLWGWGHFENDDDLAYYYAEAELYVIRNTKTLSYAFIRARSPEEALRIYKKYLK